MKSNKDLKQLLLVLIVFLGKPISWIKSKIISPVYFGLVPLLKNVKNRINVNLVELDTYCLKTESSQTVSPLYMHEPIPSRQKEPKIHTKSSTLL